MASLVHASRNGRRWSQHDWQNSSMSFDMTKCKNRVFSKTREFRSTMLVKDLFSVLYSPI